MSDKLKLQCRKCETVFEIGEMPLDATKLVQKIKRSSCPTCKEGGWKSYLYTGKKK